MEVGRGEEVLVKGEEAEVRWEEHVLGQGPAGAVSVLTVAPRLPTKKESPAIV